ncbi:nucleotide excision repair, TFIIH, subunit [Saccharata proteae CBS 121410]|uniref:General transcription and DNA repair factor IIH subunit TFB5 n=1 Tax=Saccharata proteae CBS 121410 TaxID=1314787 RepID=A0A9P4I3C2_9PEZI|nr:nucleotide excision repair, TFIIH, subunit [Saccharata proteae CBS 121410]
MVKASKGILIQCDEAIKAILTKIDREDGNAYIIEDLDEETVFIKPDKLNQLKDRLRSVLKDVVREAEESDVDE